jgi:hypothetical protein
MEQMIPITSVDLTRKDAQTLLLVMGYSPSDVNELLHMSHDHPRVTLLHPVKEQPVGSLRHDSHECAYFITWGA